MGKRIINSWLQNDVLEIRLTASSKSSKEPLSGILTNRVYLSECDLATGDIAHGNIPNPET